MVCTADGPAALQWDPVDAARCLSSSGVDPASRQPGHSEGPVPLATESGRALGSVPDGQREWKIGRPEHGCRLARTRSQTDFPQMKQPLCCRGLRAGAPGAKPARGKWRGNRLILPTTFGNSYVIRFSSACRMGCTRGRKRTNRPRTGPIDRVLVNASTGDPRSDSGDAQGGGVTGRWPMFPLESQSPRNRTAPQQLQVARPVPLV
ncbi:MAG: hypothetical protein Ct9H300mP1_06390 [Planctomycetaceae bacterium]|nr:MAG: hypothetical protein Ct9H300mP1_06390 [Planctomycetaceae bacterium]